MILWIFCTVLTWEKIAVFWYSPAQHYEFVTSQSAVHRICPLLRQRWLHRLQQQQDTGLSNHVGFGMHFTSDLMCWVSQVDPDILCILSFFFATVPRQFLLGSITHSGQNQIRYINIYIYMYIYIYIILYIYIIYYILYYIYIIYIIYYIIYICVGYVSHELCPRRGWFYNTTKNEGKSLWLLEKTSNEDLQQFHLLWHRRFSAIPGMLGSDGIGDCGRTDPECS